MHEINFKSPVHHNCKHFNYFAIIIYESPLSSSRREKYDIFRELTQYFREETRKFREETRNFRKLTRNFRE